MRTSMGPSAGGFTCSLAPVKLPSIIIETRSATPCPNCAVSTPAATLNVGVGVLSVEVFEVSSCAAPALPSFDAPESVASELLPCVRLSAALELAAAKTACATEAAVAAVTAADMAAADACANAAAGAPAADASAAEPLTAAAPVGRPVSEIAKSSNEDDPEAGWFVPCAIAAAIAACAAASVSAVGPLLEVELFSVLVSVEEGVESANAVIWDVAASRSLALGLSAPAAAVADLDIPGAASVRMPTACGMLRPEPVAVGPAATNGAVVSMPIPGAGDAAGPGAAGPGSAAGSRFGKAKMPAAPPVSAGALDAAATALGTDPAALPCAALTMAAASVTAAAEDSVLAGGSELGAGGG